MYTGTIPRPGSQPQAQIQALQAKIEAICADMVQLDVKLEKLSGISDAQAKVRACVCVCLCVRMRVPCMHACVRACVCVCV